MAEDFIYKEIKNLHKKWEDIDMDSIFNELLLDIDYQLLQMGGSLTDHTDMPQPRELSAEERLRRTFAEENFSRSEMIDIVERLMPNLNAGQAQICEDIYQAVHHSNITQQNNELSAVLPSTNKVFILSSPGGYGKTYVFKVISAKIRSEGGFVLNVASTGLAAQNLIGGRTAHSRFKIPIPIMENSTCNIKAQSDLAKLIKQTSLIIWDEVLIEN